MDPLLAAALGYVRDAGLLGMLLAAMIGGWRRWWVWGWQYDECAKERDECCRERNALLTQWADGRQVSQRLQQLYKPQDGC